MALTSCGSDSDETASEDKQIPGKQVPDSNHKASQTEVSRIAKGLSGQERAAAIVAANYLSAYEAGDLPGLCGLISPDWGLYRGCKDPSEPFPATRLPSFVRERITLEGREASILLIHPKDKERLFFFKLERRDNEWLVLFAGLRFT
jgi:hypothetical protein